MAHYCLVCAFGSRAERNRLCQRRSARSGTTFCSPIATGAAISQGRGRAHAAASPKASASSIQSSGLRFFLSVELVHLRTGHTGLSEEHSRRTAFDRSGNRDSLYRSGDLFTVCGAALPSVSSTGFAATPPTPLSIPHEDRQNPPQSARRSAWSCRLCDDVLVRGAIIAVGSGVRLRPITLGVSNQLIPVFDKPYGVLSLSTLMLAGIRKIFVITTPRDGDALARLLSDGPQFGISLAYAQQPSPRVSSSSVYARRTFYRRGERFPRPGRQPALRAWAGQSAEEIDGVGWRRHLCVLGCRAIGVRGDQIR